MRSKIENFEFLSMGRAQGELREIESETPRTVKHSNQNLEERSWKRTDSSPLLEETADKDSRDHSKITISAPSSQTIRSIIT